MASPTILNLDDLESPEDIKSFTYKGVRHIAVETTVAQYIDNLKNAKALDENAPLDQKVARTVEFLAEIFPTAKDALAALKLRQLNALIEYAVRTPKDIADAVAASPAASPDASGNV